MDEAAETEESRKAGPLRWLAFALRVLVVVAAAQVFASVFWVIFARVGYPFELEWMEGLSVDTVRRVVMGQPIYAQPSVDYVPSVYTPLYFYVSALFFDLLGGGFFPLRLVSLFATFGVVLLIGSFVYRETKRPTLAVIAVGLYAATFEWSGSWFDIARCDSLFVLLVLAAFYIVRFKRTMAGCIAAAIIVSAAFFTKQTGLSMALALILCGYIMQGRRAALVMTAVEIVLIGGGSLVINLSTDGWFGFFVFELMSGHGWREQALREFWESDIGEVGIAAVLGCFVLIERASSERRREAIFAAVFALSMLGASWLSRLHGGGYRNTLMPAYVWIAIYFGVGIDATEAYLADLGEKRQAVLGAVLSVICLFQLYGTPLHLDNQVPPERSRRAGRAMFESLSRVEGDVLFPWHGYYGAMAGRRSYTLGMSLSDVLRSEHEEVAEELTREINAAIEEQRFGAIVIDNSAGFFGGLFDRNLERCYRPAAVTFERDDVFWPVTGFRTRPERVLFPREGVEGCGRGQSQDRSLSR